MNREELKTLLPHREPMLLIDETEIDQGQAVSSYHIREDDFFLQGHFPGHPVVPGVILCEIMAQASALLIKDSLAGKTPFYTGLDKVRFRNQVHPGDTVITHSTLTGMRGPAVFIEAQAHVNGKLCCSGSLTFMLVPNDKLDQT